MRPLLAVLVLASLTPAGASAQAGEDPSLTVTLKNASTSEAATMAQLGMLLERHNLSSRWIFTREIVIDEKTGIPHSHPVLTLNTNYTDEAQLLSAFVHEQLHWFALAHEEDRDRAIAELEQLFPDLPTQPPDGSRGRFSSYQHVIVCYLEYFALKELVGEEKAREVIEFWAGHHYRGIYRLVLDQTDKIRSVIEKHNLIPAAPAPATH